LIDLVDCTDRRLYRIRSRNLSLGVFSAQSGGFFGLRTKLDDIYIFQEYHVDRTVIGTVRVIQALPETLPSDITMNSMLGTSCRNCKTPVEYRVFVDGPRTKTYEDGSSIRIPGEWIHLEFTQCITIYPETRYNEAFHHWLLLMGTKYHCSESSSG
jgi:hypothetical protein